jgi:hypothetical protein
MEDDIIREIEMWATGATIHDVKGLIGLFRTADMGVEKRKHADVPPGRDYCIALREAARTRMLSFMAHGDYRRATREHELPEPPKEGEMWTPARTPQSMRELAISCLDQQPKRLKEIAAAANESEDDIRHTLRKLVNDGKVVRSHIKEDDEYVSVWSIPK